MKPEHGLSMYYRAVYILIFGLKKYVNCVGDVSSGNNLSILLKLKIYNNRYIG